MSELDPWIPRLLRVTDVRRETADTVTLTLGTPDGFVFAPGQFTMLWQHGLGEAAVSISGAAADHAHLVHTVRDVGPTTHALCATKTGDLVGVRGPYGSAWPMVAATGGDVLFVAGGLGLAPLRPAILAVLADRAAYRRVTIIIGARDPRALMFVDDIEAWRRQAEVVVTVDRADATWTGPIGVVTRPLEALTLDASRTTLMTCGPEVMMRFVARAAAARGLPASAIWVSLERNMKCAIGLCGHCQWGPTFLCKDGAVIPWTRAEWQLAVREV